MAVRLSRPAACLLVALASCKPAGAPAHDFTAARERMVKEQVVMRGLTDARVAAAMRKVPRDAFVPWPLRSLSYTDQPLPIGYEQTISQPFIVAFMTEKLQLKPTDRVLEIGTGSGYQAAILAELAAKVYTIEIVEPFRQKRGRDVAAARLQQRAREDWRRLQRLAGTRAVRRRNCDLRAGEGSAAVDRSDEGRRPHHHSRGLARRPKTLPPGEEGWPAQARGDPARPLRAHDR